MTYTYQVTEVHLLKNSSRTVTTRTALLDRVPSGDATVVPTSNVPGTLFSLNDNLAIMYKIKKVPFGR